MSNKKIDTNVLKDVKPPYTRKEWVRNLNWALEAFTDKKGNVDNKLLWGYFRTLAKTDLFFLAVIAHDLEIMNNDYCYKMCYHFQENRYDLLRLYARGHFKSTIGTFLLTEQDMLNDNDNYAGCIFSFNSTLAKAHLSLIKLDLETNRFLKWLFPDKLYLHPKTESPLWSIDKGLVIKRKSPKKEPTLMASGLVDGLPTGMHYTDLIYDDIVTLQSVNTIEQVNKTTAAWKMSLNLGSKKCRKRYYGTPYDEYDTYKIMEDSGIKTERQSCIVGDISSNWEPVYETRDVILEKLKQMGPHVFSSQMLIDPISVLSGFFKLEWLEYWEPIVLKGSKVITFIDPSSGDTKNKGDYTAAITFLLSSDGYIRIVNMVYKRLNLTQRTKLVFDIAKRYRSGKIYYEKVGMQSDISHIKNEMDRQIYRFEITPFAFTGRNAPSKEQLIKGCEPYFSNHKILLPKECIQINPENNLTEDVTKRFIEEEYKKFPNCEHDDLLNCIGALIKKVEDKEIEFPQDEEELRLQRESLNIESKGDYYSWDIR